MIKSRLNLTRKHDFLRKLYVVHSKLLHLVLFLNLIHFRKSESISLFLVLLTMAQNSKVFNSICMFLNNCTRDLEVHKTDWNSTSTLYTIRIGIGFALRIADQNYGTVGLIGCGIAALNFSPITHRGGGRRTWEPPPTEQSHECIMTPPPWDLLWSVDCLTIR